MSSFHWAIHDSVNYYVTIKAANTIGLFVLATGHYTHFSEDPSDGVVYDVNPNENRQVTYLNVVMLLVIQINVHIYETYNRHNITYLYTCIRVRLWCSIMLDAPIKGVVFFQ